MQDISVLETLSEEIGQIKDAAVFIKGGVIEWVGTTKDVPKELSKPDKTISLADHVVSPGLVNTHHHMFQCLTRCIAQVKVCMGPPSSLRGCLMRVLCYCQLYQDLLRADMCR